MKSIIFAAALIAVAANVQGKNTGQEPAKETAIACSVEHLPKSWNLKVKASVSKEVVKESLGEKKFTSPKTFQEIRMTLEFADNPAQVKEIRKYLIPESKLPKAGDPAAKGPQVQLFLFDSEKVVLGKMNLHEIVGEITGVTGDAFRVVCYCEPELFKKVKFIELRPINLEK